MRENFRSKNILLMTLIAIVILFAVFTSLRLDFDNRDRCFQNVVKDNPDAMEVFEKLMEVTPEDAVIFSWWDYGRAIEEFGRREAVVAHPSRDIIRSVGGSQNPVYAFEMQFFGKFESPEKIRDVAKAFLLPEEESLAIMKRYGASYVMVFCEKEVGAFNDFYKLVWIAKIADQNYTDYLTIEGVGEGGYNILSPKDGNATMLRLIYDEQFHPRYFTKIFENEVAKIYKIDYAGSDTL